MALSRSAKFARSLVSGYGLMGVNTVYSLLSVPIVLHYLSKSEFGLWALVTQMAGYIALVDLGMTGAVVRTLIDHKDDRDGSAYGSVIQTGFYVNVIQAVLITLAGMACSLFALRLFAVEPVLQGTLTRLLLAQCVVVGLGFMLRPVSVVLEANQRYDIWNITQIFQQVLNLLVLWGALHLGAGIFSLVWAGLAAQLFYIVFAGIGCVRLHLLPERGKWGRPTWLLFRELFSFGLDVFVFALGSQLVNASQVILLTHVLGLEAAAVWSVCLRTFNLITQFIYRVFDFSSGALAEMMVRNEKARLLSRFRSITILSGSLVAVCAVLFELCNQSFVQLWTGGKIAWSQANDALLAIWLVLLVFMHIHTGLVGLTKKFEALRYLYFLEGVFFAGVSLLVIPRWGTTGMIATSIAATCLFSLQNGLRRTCRYFDLPMREVLGGWSLPSLRVLFALIPIALLAHWLFAEMPVIPRLSASALSVGLPGAFLFLRFGIDQDLKGDLLNRFPTKLRPIVNTFICSFLKPIRLM
ncbi:MAG: oligosaccharide flippase family protein [Verrucomicrobiota bacterium]